MFSIKKIWKQRVLAMMMVVAILSINTLPVLAAEVDRHDDAVVTTQYEENGAHVLEINWDDMMEVLDDDLSPYESRAESSTNQHYFVNEAGYTSSDLDILFDVDMPFIGNVYFILNCKYTDGTTGTLTGKMASYSGTVYVDGVTRTIGSGLTLAPGTQHVKITGIKKQMSYVVKVYSLR